MKWVCPDFQTSLVFEPGSSGFFVFRSSPKLTQTTSDKLLSKQLAVLDFFEPSYTTAPISFINLLVKFSPLKDLWFILGFHDSQIILSGSWGMATSSLEALVKTFGFLIKAIVSSILRPYLPLK